MQKKYFLLQKNTNVDSCIYISIIGKLINKLWRNGGEKMRYIDRPLYNTICWYIEEDQYEELNIDDIRCISSIEADTSEFINYLGIRSKLKGYRYIKESIYIELLRDTKYDIKEDSTTIGAIANKNNTEKTNIERSIRYAIQDLKKNRDYEELNQILGCDIFSKNDIPTNMEFVFCAAEKIRNSKTIKNSYMWKKH